MTQYDDVPKGAVFGARIHAAGVVALRGEGKRTEVLVLYRPHRDDWSLPKGKADPGERLATTAVRETLEETGLRVRLGIPLRTARYTVLDRRSDSPLYAKKSVNYWLAHIDDEAVAVGDQDLPDGWEPNDEVSEMRWVRIDRAPDLLTYAHDVEVIEDALQGPFDTTPFILLRHAAAEKRAEYRARVGEEPADDLRPLTEVGAQQAIALADVLAAYGIQEIASSSAERCMATVRPYAERLAQDVKAVDALTEGAFADNPQRGINAVRERIDRPAAGVACLHRPTLPRIMKQLGDLLHQPDPDPALKPAEYVVLHRVVSKREADGSVRKVKIGRSTIVEPGFHH